MIEMHNIYPCFLCWYFCTGKVRICVLLIISKSDLLLDLINNRQLIYITIYISGITCKQPYSMILSLFFPLLILLYWVSRICFLLMFSRSDLLPDWINNRRLIYINDIHIRNDFLSSLFYSISCSSLHNMSYWYCTGFFLLSLLNFINWFFSSNICIFYKFLDIL